MSLTEIYNNLYVSDVIELCEEHNESIVINNGRITDIVENDEV